MFHILWDHWSALWEPTGGTVGGCTIGAHQRVRAVHNRYYALVLQYYWLGRWSGQFICFCLGALKFYAFNMSVIYSVHHTSRGA